MAVAAGTDLLCFGRDQDQLTYLRVRDALVAAVQSGRLPASRLEESAARVSDLRAWVTSARELAPAPAAARRAFVDHTEVGMVAARRALRWEGELGPLADPVLVEIVPPSNVAVGTVPWGLSRWVRPDSVYRFSTGQPDVEGESDGDRARVAREVLADTARGRPLLIVVRDAHRHPVAQSVVQHLLAARPAAVVVEMGLPVWHPPTRSYLATFGATRASSLAAAELFGLAADLTQEVSARGPDRP